MKRLFCAFTMTAAFILFSASATEPQDLQRINTEIEQLQNKIHLQRVEAMNAEANSQMYMKADFGKYTDEIQKAEDAEVNISKLQEQLKKLQDEKQEIVRRSQGL